MTAKNSSLEKTNSGISEEESSESWETLRNVVEELKGSKGSLIPMLQSAQGIFGYLPDSVLKYISDETDISYSEVAGVVSFYSFFSRIPRGKNIIRVCLGTACYVRGAKEVLASFKKELNIDVGETTDDRIFSLEVGRCFGACGLAPVVMINDDVFQRVKTSKIKSIIASYMEDSNG